MPSRREFLEFSAAALAGAVARKAEAAPETADGEWRNRQPGMSYRRLGRTGYLISEVGMGGNLIAPDRHEHVLLAVDMGLNYFDTAPVYGEGKSEQGYALVVKARGRDRVFLNSKVSLWDLNRNRLYQEIFDSLPAPEQKRLRHAVRERMESSGALETDYIADYFKDQRAELEAATLSDVMAERYGGRIDRGKHYRQLILDSVDGSLRRLGTDYLDLLMCPHGANTPTEVKHPEIAEAFERLRKAGKVRHFGVSAHTNPAGILETAIDLGHYAAAMIAVNIINHRYLGKALDRARQAEVGVIAMKAARPVHPGDGRYEPSPARVRKIQEAVPGPLKVPLKAYAWVLRDARVAAVISEMGDAALVRENLGLAAPRPRG
jgi:aryl-alcohol dehydrogenase-like predicted oxidoreductase